MASIPATGLFDRPKYERLKARYAQAVAAHEEVFTFEGHDYLTSYAKYLIEYLTKFKFSD